MNWITRLIERPSAMLGGSKQDMPEGLWIKCPDCCEAVYNKEMQRSLTDGMPQVWSSSSYLRRAEG